MFVNMDFFQIEKGLSKRACSKRNNRMVSKIRVSDSEVAYPEHTKGEVPICLLWEPTLKEVISHDQVTKESFNQHQSKMVYSQENPQVTGILAIYIIYEIYTIFQSVPISFIWGACQNPTVDELSFWVVATRLASAMSCHFFRECLPWMLSPRPMWFCRAVFYEDKTSSFGWFLQSIVPSLIPQNMCLSYISHTFSLIRSPSIHILFHIH